MVEWEVLLKDNSNLIIQRKESQDQRFHSPKPKTLGLGFVSVDCISKSFERWLFGYNMSRNMILKQDYKNSGMKISFISQLSDMTSNHYLQQPKQMIERALIKSLNENPEQINHFQRCNEKKYNMNLLSRSSLLSRLSLLSCL